jgi:type 1 fimbriae regulatory protein FimB/type 1 fimbriae regulatory protein FimE
MTQPAKVQKQASKRLTKHERPTSLLHVTEKQMQILRRFAGKSGRNRHRDSTMILMAFRHGLRVSELVRLRWDQVKWETNEINIIRRKGSRTKMHYMEDDEVAALQKLEGEQTGWIFKSERGNGTGKMTESGFRKMVLRTSRDANFDFDVHPHMFRHGCGFWLHLKGWSTIEVQKWLGHVSIHHTVQYIADDADSFRREREREYRK